mgnify:CR=1 FL=1
MSKIKFLEEQYIEVCVGFDDDEEPIMEEVKVLKDMEFDFVDVIYDEINDDIVQVQFGDGSVSFISKDSIEIEEYED